MENIALYSHGIYLLPNESTGDDNYMLHEVGASGVLIGEYSQDNIKINCMNHIMDIYKYAMFLLLSLYQSNRNGRMLNVDLPKYLDL